MKKKPFTNLEHLGMGARLSRIADDLMLIGNALGNAYDRSVFDKATRALHAVQRLQSTMDGKISSENPMSVVDIEGIGILKVYYGWGVQKPLVQGEDARKMLANEAAVALAQRSERT